MALIQMGSVEEAIESLIEFHNHDLGENHHLRVSFSKSSIWTTDWIHLNPARFSGSGLSGVHYTPIIPTHVCRNHSKSGVMWLNYFFRFSFRLFVFKGDKGPCSLEEVRILDLTSEFRDYKVIIEFVRTLKDEARIQTASFL